jgi:hypothetical protein
MPGKQKRWESTARVGFFAAVVAWPIATACSGASTSSKSSDPGDNTTNDTRDAQPNPIDPDPGDDAGPDANANTGPTYYSEGGTYPGLAECGDCYCNPDKYYCFGGATARTGSIRFHDEFTPFAGGDAGKGDAGQPACPIIDASAPQLGCNVLPTACPPSAATCGCVIGLLQSQYSCTLVCASDGVGSPITAYCPNM